MKIRTFLWVTFVLIPGLLPAQVPRSGRLRDVSSISLEDDWRLQSSALVSARGDVLSTDQYQPKGWYPASVPSTVLAALVKNNVYPDPMFGMNLRFIPGTTYPIGRIFSSLPMPEDSPFAVPWWYRKEFVLPAAMKGKAIWLDFGGLNYRAGIWLNGVQIATPEDAAGAYRVFEFDITGSARPGERNILAVQVYPPGVTDLAITFVDWNPMPPDKSMGLWREVTITTSGHVALRHPTVISRVNSPANDRASLTVAAVLKNSTSRVAAGTLKGRIGGIGFAQELELAPAEVRDVAFEPDRYPQLTISRPRLWWPAQAGQPEMYDLELEFETAGAISDRAAIQFGIREITSELNADKKRVFSVNGKKILIRGGGWAPDMMLRQDPRRFEDEMRYVRDMGLNTIRLEGKLESNEFFDLADRYGIFIMAGWCCCDHWEQWPKWVPQDYRIAEESLRSQMYRLRSHPSLLMWLNGSDNPPPADVEKMYLDVERQCRWPNPILSSATARPTTVTGESGVKMTGPYEYIAPSYWLLDSRRGGAYGFNTETSPGPAVPPVESLRAMLPQDHLWPIDEVWNFHAGGGNFRNIRIFTEALETRYGAAGGLEDFALKSQLMAYEGIRAMFEAYSRNKYTSTGVIQWMLNNAWPSLIWHLYDYYLRPGGGYFGAKIAMEPLHPLYSYNDRSIWVVSSQYRDAKGLRLTAKVFNLGMTEKFSRQATLDAPSDSTNKIMDIPEIQDASPVHFLVLRLEDASGKPVGSNFYWLSTKPETLAWEKSNYYVTPTASFADFTALRQLPEVELKVKSRTRQRGSESETSVTLENPSRNLAFFIRLKITRGAGGPEILPVLWQDNYFSLLPGERREIVATCRREDLGNATPAVEVTGWNVKRF